MRIHNFLTVSLVSLTLVLLTLAGCSRSTTPSNETGPSAAAAPSPAPGTELSYINTGDVRTKPQLLSGWYAIEEGAWRWTAKEAQAVLATPQQSPVNFELRLFLPEAHVKQAGGPVIVSVLLDGNLFAEETYARGGGHTILKPVPAGSLPNPTTKVSFRLNRAVGPTAVDRRELGMVVQGFGFQK